MAPQDDQPHRELLPCTCLVSDAPCMAATPPSSPPLQPSIGPGTAPASDAEYKPHSDSETDSSTYHESDVALARSPESNGSGGLEVDIPSSCTLGRERSDGDSRSVGHEDTKQGYMSEEDVEQGEEAGSRGNEIPESSPGSVVSLDQKSTGLGNDEASTDASDDAYRSLQDTIDGAADRAFGNEL